MNNKVFERKIIPSNAKNLSQINREMRSMLIKYTVVPKYIIFIIFLSVLVACNKEKNATAADCIEVPNSCLILHSDAIKITFNTSKIFVENRYQFSLSSKHAIKNVFIEGVSMAMGKIPVLIDLTKDTQYSYQGYLMLGMCAEPTMKWQFVIETEQNGIVRLPFISNWPHGKS